MCLRKSSSGLTCLTVRLDGENLNPPSFVHLSTNPNYLRFSLEILLFKWLLVLISKHVFLAFLNNCTFYETANLKDLKQNIFQQKEITTIEA